MRTQQPALEREIALCTSGSNSDACSRRPLRKTSYPSSLPLASAPARCLSPPRLLQSILYARGGRERSSSAPQFSTSTTPVKRSRPGRTIARRSLCSPGGLVAAQSHRVAVLKTTSSFVCACAATGKMTVAVTIAMITAIKWIPHSLHSYLLAHLHRDFQFGIHAANQYTFMCVFGPRAPDSGATLSEPGSPGSS